MYKKIIIIFIFFFIFASSLNAEIKFLPENCNGLIIFNSSSIFDISLLKDDYSKAKFQKIIEEVSKKTGVNIIKEAKTIGFYITNLNEFIKGARPKGALFLNGSFKKEKILNKLKSKTPTTISKFKLYPTGDGTALAFIGDNEILFGGLDDVLAGLMANKKSSMSNRTSFATLASKVNSSTFILGTTLEFNKSTSKFLLKLAQDNKILIPILSEIKKLNLFYDSNSGLELELISSSDDYSAKAKAPLKMLTTTGKLLLNKSAQNQKDSSFSFSKEIFNNMVITGRKDRIGITIKEKYLTQSRELLLASFLKIFSRNYNVAQGNSGEKRCINNMKILEGASELCFMDEKVSNRAEVTMDKLIKNSYIRKIPKCPKGGKYTIIPLKDGFSIKCSVHGNLDDIYDKLYNPKKVK